MSNLEREPAEILVAERPDAGPGPVEILAAREVPLGGPRAMTVRRTLPQRGRSLIGAWCFVDHYGPDDVSHRTGMVVPPHPHTGLQTISWLFAGEVEHRDSAGHHALVRPGELNLMTAGRGIQHSEVSTPDATVLHGAQLWVALPDADRHTDPTFDHFAPEPVRLGAATLRVFLGEVGGGRSPVRTFSPLLGAQIDLPAGARVELAVDAGFEHGVLVDTGELLVGGTSARAGELAYLPPGETALVVEAGDGGPVRALLIGGVPFGEEIVMWWNFIGRTHDEIVELRRRWQSEVIDGTDAAGRFGHVAGYPGAPLPAPAMPSVRLRPRG